MTHTHTHTLFERGSPANCPNGNCPTGHSPRICLRFKTWHGLCTTVQSLPIRPHQNASGNYPRIVKVQQTVVQPSIYRRHASQTIKKVQYDNQSYHQRQYSNSTIQRWVTRHISQLENRIFAWKNVRFFVTPPTQRKMLMIESLNAKIGLRETR